MVTTSANFGVLGGDSLAATRVVRTLFANHKGIRDNRYIGGAYGVLDGPFDALHLLRAETLGAYVDFLDGHGVCSAKDGDDCYVDDDDCNRE
eukprot:10153298-Ditylum_brightwellii.AAC.1